MSKKINYWHFFKEKILPFFLSILVIIFWYISYGIDSEINIVRTIGSYIDDTLLYKRIYSDNNHANEVVIVKIDERTLNDLQKSDIKVLSFSKELYGQAITNLIEHYKVSTIWVDIIFANSSHYGEEDEKKLKDVLDSYHDKIVIASRWDMKDTPLCLYSDAKHGAIEIVSEHRVRKTSISFKEYDISQKCKNATKNIHGIEAFWVEVYKSFLSTLPNKIKAKNSLRYLGHKLKEQKQENAGRFYFNYSTNKENNTGTFGFRSYSLIDIIEKKEIDLEGKIILIGEVGTVLHDTQFTPINFTYQMPGVEIHANIVTSLLYNSYLTQAANNLIIILSYLSSCLLFFTIIYTRTLTNTLIAIFLLLIHLIIGLQLFVVGVIYPVFFMMYITLLSFITAYIYKFSITDKNRRFLKRAFSMYVSPDMVDIIYKDPTKLNLKWESSKITVFFSDIANFTTLGESMKTEELFYFLNDYFSEMTKVLLMHQGTLDKYIGDAVMAFFGAPLKVENHELQACKTALAQQKRLIVLNKRNKEKWLPEIQIRIGINTGEVMHGNLWSSGKKINYTVIGDDVNIASRLEGLGKVYGTNILISENTYKKVKDDFLFRQLDTIMVKWKTKAVKIYELLWELKEKENYESLIADYSRALNEYYSNNYNDALKIFASIKNDTASKLMIERIKEIQSGKTHLEKWAYKFTQK